MYDFFSWSVDTSPSTIPHSALWGVFLHQLSSRAGLFHSYVSQRGSAYFVYVTYCSFNHLLSFNNFFIIHEYKKKPNPDHDLRMIYFTLCIPDYFNLTLNLTLRPWSGSECPTGYFNVLYIPCGRTWIHAILSKCILLKSWHIIHTPSVFSVAISGMMNRKSYSCVNKANTVDHCEIISITEFGTMQCKWRYFVMYRCTSIWDCISLVYIYIYIYIYTYNYLCKSLF